MFLVFLLSCSSPSRPIIRKLEGNDRAVRSGTKGELPQLFSPSNKGSNTFFIDETSRYFGEKIVGQKLYAIDLNNDGWVDLVTLDEVYSSPKFYFFSRQIGKFVKYTGSVFSKTVLASFLNFVDLNKDGVQDVFVGTLNQNTAFNKNNLRKTSRNKS